MCCHSFPWTKLHCATQTANQFTNTNKNEWTKKLFKKKMWNKNQVEKKQNRHTQRGEKTSSSSSSWENFVYGLIAVLLRALLVVADMWPFFFMSCNVCAKETISHRLIHVVAWRRHKNCKNEWRTSALNYDFSLFYLARRSFEK